MFKKYITAFFMAVLLVMSVPLIADAQVRTHTRYYRTRSGRLVAERRPGFYRRHRKLVNIGGGAVGGAILGGLIGGRKGALIGGAAGAGTGAIITHKQRPKHYTRRYYVRRARNY